MGADTTGAGAARLTHQRGSDNVLSLASLVSIVVFIVYLTSGSAVDPGLLPEWRDGIQNQTHRW